MSTGPPRQGGPWPCTWCDHTRLCTTHWLPCSCSSSPLVSVTGSARRPAASPSPLPRGLPPHPQWPGMPPGVRGSKQGTLRARIVACWGKCPSSHTPLLPWAMTATHSHPKMEMALARLAPRLPPSSRARRDQAKAGTFSSCTLPSHLSWEYFRRKSLALRFSCQSLLLGNMSSDRPSFYCF